MTAARFDHGAFARALLDPALPPPCALPERRFAVHRNNVVAALVDALAERFPVTLRLVGEEFFRAMAGAHVRRTPPSSPILAQYGAEFPIFIEGFAPARELPFLADVARLEYAVGLAYHAADATPLPLEDIAEALKCEPDRRLVLHPSVQFVSSRHPIVSIWRVNMSDAPRGIDLRNAQDALLSRCDGEVEVSALPAGGFRFTRALAQGARLSEAAAEGEASAESFDLASCLGALFLARAIVAIA
jgi:Putative DNA-binding domain